ncbi:MAG: hypothetical protein OXH50_21030 [Gemmatimonadetes bacterium]|nr:hypothetical protein [Gemmatimonadota bacterium]
MVLPSRPSSTASQLRPSASERAFADISRRFPTERLAVVRFEQETGFAAADDVDAPPPSRAGSGTGREGRKCNAISLSPPER